MTPGNIVGMAALKGLDVIALTDHNSCKNCEAVLKLAEEFGIVALPGMELCTSEEVHVVCLFEELTDALAFDQYVSEHMLKIPNQEDIFGQQLICNEDDVIVGKEPILLISASEISFDEVYDLVESYHGIMIPAHIDKNSNSLISNLGFIPPDSRFHTVEVKDLTKLPDLTLVNPYIKKCKVISDSDAHYLEHINEADHYIHANSRAKKDILKALIKPSIKF